MMVQYQSPKTAIPKLTHFSKYQDMSEPASSSEK